QHHRQAARQDHAPARPDPAPPDTGQEAVRGRQDLAGLARRVAVQTGVAHRGAGEEIEEVTPRRPPRSKKHRPHRPSFTRPARAVPRPMPDVTRKKPPWPAANPPAAAAAAVPAAAAATTDGGPTGGARGPDRRQSVVDRRTGADRRQRTAAESGYTGPERRTG